MYNQMIGKYKIKNEQLRVLYDQAQHMIPAFKKFLIKHVPREKNKEADNLASKAINKGQIHLVASLF